MKRGKDEENTMGPMFPRLHVNDTAEKGGPRAPPRNKMALYEQLSIPSQRFGSGATPLNPQTKPSLPSPSQGSGVDGSVAIKHHLSSSTTTPWSEKFLTNHRDETYSLGAQFDQGKKIGDEDDFTVPVFNQARVGKIQNNNNVGALPSISSGQSAEPTKLGGRNGRESDFRAKETSDQDCSSNFSRSRQESRVGAEVDSSRRNDDLVQSKRCRRRSESSCGEERGKVIELDDDTERDSNSNRSCNSLQFESVDKADEVSETSVTVIDSALRVDITPDDVVGIIGQKHFWNARKAIVNQQRVFAVQVFELHRLIKVQRLIAGSPNILVEEDVFLGKPLTKDSPIKKLPTELVVKPLPVVANCKDGFEKPSHRKEFSTVTPVEKSDISSVKNESASYGTFVEKPQLSTTTNDSNNKTNPWYFHQPPGPQWLVPVMSPTDGLVYKPYAGPGAPGALYGGGYGSFGPIPMMGNYPNSATGASHGHGIHMYFPPPFGMPGPNPAMSGSAVEQPSQITGPSAQSQTGLVAEGGRVNLTPEQQSSCTAPSTISQAKILRGSKRCSDLQQGSTASSGHEMSTRVRFAQNADGKDPISLFSSATVATGEKPRTRVADQLNRAIKVVPHNPRSATESAARIFRFIQEERKLYDTA